MPLLLFLDVGSAGWTCLCSTGVKLRHYPCPRSRSLLTRALPRDGRLPRSAFRQLPPAAGRCRPHRVAVFVGGRSRAHARGKIVGSPPAYAAGPLCPFSFVPVPLRGPVVSVPCRVLCGTVVPGRGVRRVSVRRFPRASLRPSCVRFRSSPSVVRCASRAASRIAFSACPAASSPCATQASRCRALCPIPSRAPAHHRRHLRTCQVVRAGRYPGRLPPAVGSPSSLSAC